MKKLLSIPDVVRAFGGPATLAAWCGIRAAEVTRWVRHNHIPPGWHYRLDREASHRGFQIDGLVFDERLRGKP